MRRFLTKFRLSDHNLEIELGRRKKPRIEEKNRLCTKCNKNEVENEVHFILDCDLYKEERKSLFKECNVETNQEEERLNNFIKICKSSIPLAKYLKNTIYKNT